jgi:methylated-DNA-[protein]-cysteine S-methyltransferase
MDSGLAKEDGVIYKTRYASPIGSLTATAEDDQLVGLSVGDATEPRADEWMAPEDYLLFRELESQLASYWQGEPVAFDVPLAPRGTAFQKRVWAALLEIPRGNTISYGELARRIDRPAAVRAVGRANGANPISILIPCHRVIGGKGTLTGYAWGLERKRKLLLLEGALTVEAKDATGIPVRQI